MHSETFFDYFDILSILLMLLACMVSRCAQCHLFCDPMIIIVPLNSMTILELPMFFCQKQEDDELPHTHGITRKKGQPPMPTSHSSSKMHAAGDPRYSRPPSKAKAGSSAGHSFGHASESLGRGHASVSAGSKWRQRASAPNTSASASASGYV